MITNDNIKKFLTANELVERWRGAISVGTLANWRMKRQGPTFCKLGTKVLYPLDQVEEWEAANMSKPSNDNDGAAK